EGIKKGKQEGIKEGIREGIKEGESLLASLLNLLFADGRTEDAKKAAADAAERNKLYKEYGIV
ncbi:MAG: transposase, partial [Butyrivibrio sp.]|nr:transposase [Butyrivibrio sp.]